MSVFDKVFYFLLVGLNLIVAIGLFYIGGLILTAGWNFVGMPELEVWQGVALLVLLSFLGLPLFHARES